MQAAELVNLDKWDRGDANIVWGDAVVCMLKAYGVDSDHIELVKANNCGLRLLPEEVAAAAELPRKDRPALQADIAVRSSEIVKEMRQICGQPAAPWGLWAHVLWCAKPA